MFFREVPIYVLCNKYNEPEIVEFWQENNLFGLPQSDVLFFLQDEVPIFDRKGRGNRKVRRMVVRERASKS